MIFIGSYFKKIDFIPLFYFHTYVLQGLIYLIRKNHSPIFRRTYKLDNCLFIILFHLQSVLIPYYERFLVQIFLCSLTYSQVMEGKLNYKFTRSIQSL